MKTNDPQQTRPHAAVHALPHGGVHVDDAFWTPRRELVRRTALLRQWEQLERTGCVDNFRIAAGDKSGAYRGWGFADSDLYKWLEAAALVLGRHPEDEPLAAHAQEVISLIRSVQMHDGYINTYYQIAAPGRRYSNLLMKHELYCLGHLIEAGCTHRRATGSTELFQAAARCGDHIAATFGRGRNEGVPGHEEVELALMRLYRATGRERYMETAKFFLTQRGRPGVFRRMVRQALRDLWKSSPLVQPPATPFKPAKPQAAESSVDGKDKDPAGVARGLALFPTQSYFQMHAPLRDHVAAEGHSVRAMYLYTAAGDLLLETGEPALRKTLERVWDNTISKRTYITGGMGAFPFCEGFGRDYELPNRSYTETCAGIGSFLFSWRMLQATGHARFAAQMERTLYNAVLGCMSRDGELYFYSNPLESSGHTERREWYDVPCCPPNLARLFHSLEQYIYGHRGDMLLVHHYIGSSADVALDHGQVSVSMQTGLPFHGHAQLKVDIPHPARFTIKLRIPDWARHVEFTVNGDAQPVPAAGEYAALDREWSPGDEVRVSFGMEPEARRDARVKTNRGRIAIVRGPFIYCVQGADNPGLDVLNMTVDTSAPLETQPQGDMVVVTGRTTRGETFTAVPYFDWGNSGRTPMAVWLRAR